MSALICTLDNYELADFTGVAAGFGSSRYGYVVTPNTDHLIRLHRDPSFRAIYAEASYVLLDSRFLAHLLRLTRRLRLPVCTGSDLTTKLFTEVIHPDDDLVLIGASSDQASRLRRRFGLTHLAHFNPPMGFINDPQAVEACLRFIEANSPFRYCLLAIGAPQQEFIAQRLSARGVARGMALCIGGSINFLTGEELRAPGWAQRLGIEWLVRLVRSPRRFARRYLITGPRIFSLLGRTKFVLRPRPSEPVAMARNGN
jgi:exopolysaccharide biosynthesis WecB/TagA/CpsF family protein